MFLKTNILIHTFSQCSVSVKIVHFRAYCLDTRMYDVSIQRLMPARLANCAHAITDVLNCILLTRGEII
jgi:hypothetical protein